MAEQLASIQTASLAAEARLTVIIVSYNTRSLLRDCLNDLGATRRLMELQVIVVDNCSSDGSAEMVAADFPAVDLIRNPRNAGFAAAVNAGLSRASGRYIALLNTDTRLQPGALPELVRFLRSHPRAGAVGPRLLNQDGSYQPSSGVFPGLRSYFVDTVLTRVPVAGRRWWRRRLLHRPEDITEVSEVDWVSGACLVATADAFRQAGVLDESFPMYEEEIDWCYRLRCAGCRVYYVPAVQVVHLGGASWAGAAAGRRLQMYQARHQFLSKHCGPVAHGLITARFIALFSVYLVRSFFSRWLAGRRAQEQQIAVDFYLRALRWHLRPSGMGALPCGKE